MRTSRRSGGIPVALAATFASIVAVQSVDAQERERPSVGVTGAVEDRQRGSGVSGADLRFHLLEEDEDGTTSSSRLVARTLSEGGGRFSVDRIPAGRYLLLVDALGYSTFEEQVEVDGHSHIEVGLVPEAIELEPLIAVSRRSRYLQDVGFYDRRETGRRGSTFTRDEIQRRPGSLISDLLRTIPGVTVRQAGLAGASVLFRAGCRPDLVLDGINLGSDARVDDLVRPGDVEGLEVHRGGTTFLPFSNSSCGTLVVWTIDPSNREGGRPWTWGRALAAGLFALGALFLTR